MAYQMRSVSSTLFELEMPLRIDTHDVSGRGGRKMRRQDERPAVTELLDKFESRTA